MIRPVRPDDVPAVLALVQDLAAYERARSEVLATEPDLLAALFGPNPRVFCLVAEEAPGGPGEPGAASDAVAASDGVAASDRSDLPAPVVGYALWFCSFSTWLGRHGVYVEDLYVRPEVRGRGHGRALLAELARICVERGYGRLEWSVLDWNVDAHAFYRTVGAVPMQEWSVWRLTGDALGDLGSR